MNAVEVPKQPLKTQDAAGRRFTVRFKAIGHPDMVKASVYGNGLETEILIPVDAPVLNWGWYARKALKLALQKTFGITATRTEEDSNGSKA